MNSTRLFVGSVALVTVTLFGALIVQSLGLFDFYSPSRAAPADPSRRIGNISPEKNDPGRGTDSSTDRLHTEPVSANGADAINQLAELKQENSDLKSSNELLENRLTAVLNWILANFRGKFPLPESFMKDVRVVPLTEDFMLNPELADFLKVTGEEELKINDAFAYAHDYMREIETALMTVNMPREGKVILHIPTFEEDGELLKEDLYSALEVTLGENRFDRFLKVSEEELKNTFSQFGEASRTMVFELVYTDENSPPQLKIKDGYVINLSPNVRNVTATETYVTNMPAKYSAYLAWLPDYISAYADEPLSE